MELSHAYRIHEDKYRNVHTFHFVTKTLFLHRDKLLKQSKLNLRRNCLGQTEAKRCYACQQITLTQAYHMRIMYKCYNNITLCHKLS